ncbi:MAG: hypothetical protein GY906_18540 [bacterium]|nr:hypothetical protein [bacterium]
MNRDGTKSDVADYVTGTTGDSTRRRASGPRFVNNTFRSTALGCEGEPVLAPNDNDEVSDRSQVDATQQEAPPTVETEPKRTKNDETIDRMLMRLGGNGF